jgi:hypothetical protein
LFVARHGQHGRFVEFAGSPMQHPGFEIYAGDGELVRAACLADRLEELRAGEVTRSLVHFPQTFQAGDLLLMERAVAAITGRCEPLEISRVEALPGLFVDQLDKPWVRSVASVGEDRAAELQEQWIEAYFQEENRLPDWSDCDHGELVARLISLCRESIDLDLDLLLVWLL